MRSRIAAIAICLGLITGSAVLSTGPAGAATSPATVSASATQTALVKQASVRSGKVSISGSVKVGAKLRVTTSRWKTSGTKLTYRWLRNGKAISGATKSRYTLKAKDRGKSISVRVTGKAAGYKSKAVTSKRTKKVAAGSIKAATPRITGAKTTGTTLKANAGSWKPAGTKLYYRWMRDGRAIAGATKSTYKLVTADEGKRISVTVTGKKTGFTTAKKSSAKTTAVMSFYAHKFGTFATQTYTGYGDDIVVLPKSQKAIMVTSKHSGSGHFSIVSRSANYGYGDLLVNTTGQYSGTTAVGVDLDEDPTGIFEIDANGPWSITLKPIDAAPTLKQAGTTDGVYKYNGSQKVAAIKHSSSGYFGVWQHYIDRSWGNRWSWDLLVNEVGPYSGKRILNSGPSIVEIRSEGPWTFTR